MAVTGTVYVFGDLIGEPEGRSSVQLSWAITAGKSQSVTDLASGANTITVPSGTTLVVIVPPTDNTQTITQKGVSGDTGHEISRTKPTIIAWQTGTTFVLTAGAAITGLKVLFI